ncbi:MAG: EAL domain-containing protein [Treponema sp.]|nr:EAL domain-containing protein [Treponema sp.]
MAEINYEEYTKAFEEAVTKLQSINGDRKKIPPLLEKICSILRIAKINVIKEPLNSDMSLHGELETVLFDGGDCDDTRYLVFTEKTENVVKIDFIFFQKKDSEDWDDGERERIHSLQKIIFVHLGWFQLIDFFKNIQNYDTRFHVHNVSYAFEQIQKHIDNGTLNEYGLASFNIHRLTTINRQMGEKKGTLIIKKYFQEIEAIIKNKGFICATGGDNGIILFKKELLETLVAFFAGVEIKIDDEIDGKIELKSHAGIRTDMDDFNSIPELIDSVNMLVQLSKQKSGLKIIFYDDDIKKHNAKKKHIEQIFKAALRNEEFKVFYQPKVNLHNYSLCGAEALVRWIRADEKIFPDEFIPIIENNGSIKNLDLYMLNHVCASLKRWINEGKKVVPVSVNLSRATLHVPNLLNMIFDTIDSYRIPHTLIQIELTESASGANDIALKHIITGLHEAGISTAIDDFGTGFSSLSIIHDLPWDVLKIDKSLLKGSQKEGSREQIMFKSIISMAKNIDLTCIVEGVETREDVRLLKESDCYLAQGYYFDRPMPEEDFEKKL